MVGIQDHVKFGAPRFGSSRFCKIKINFPKTTGAVQMCAHCGTGTVDFPEVPPLILISPLTRLISGGGVQNLLRNYPASPNPTYGKLAHIPQPDIWERVVIDDMVGAVFSSLSSFLSSHF